MFSKPKFWDDKIGIYSIILFPFTLITLIFIFLKKKFTKNKIQYSNHMCGKYLYWRNR